MNKKILIISNIIISIILIVIIINIAMYTININNNKEKIENESNNITPNFNDVQEVKTESNDLENIVATNIETNDKEQKREETKDNNYIQKETEEKANKETNETITKKTEEKVQIATSTPKATTNIIVSEKKETTKTPEPKATPKATNVPTPQPTSKPIGNPELAFQITTKENIEKENQAIAWIKDELSKSPEAVKQGFTVQRGTESVAKGKVDGFSFYESRIRNRVRGAGGNFYVFVEDHYIYDSTGTTQNLGDTWIYIYIQ